MGIKERGVIPPVQVEVFRDGRWHRGQLDRWSQQPDGWYGQVRIDQLGLTNWYHYPDHLRKVG